DDVLHLGIKVHVSHHGLDLVQDDDEAWQLFLRNGIHGLVGFLAQFVGAHDAAKVEDPINRRCGLQAQKAMAHGPYPPLTIFAGSPLLSKSSALTWPRASAASFNVVPSRWALLAISALL